MGVVTRTSLPAFSRPSTYLPREGQYDAIQVLLHETWGRNALTGSWVTAGKKPKAAIAAANAKSQSVSRRAFPGKACSRTRCEVDPGFSSGDPTRLEPGALS